MIAAASDITAALSATELSTSSSNNTQANPAMDPSSSDPLPDNPENSLDLEEVQLVNDRPGYPPGKKISSFPSTLTKELHLAPPALLNLFTRNSDYSEKETKYMLSEILKCCLCNSLLKEPVILHCGWSCCRECFDLEGEEAKDIFCQWIKPQNGEEVSSKPCHLRKMKSEKSPGKDVVLSKVLGWFQKSQIQVKKEFQSAPTSPSIHKRKRSGSFNEDSFSVIEVKELVAEFQAKRSVNEKGEVRAKSLPPGLTSLDFIEEDELQNLLDCQVCFNILYDPFTCPCGHTYCRDCLIRCIDHQPSCPICRSSLPSFDLLTKSHVLNRLIPFLLPEAYKMRSQSILQQQKEEFSTIPIFVCGVVFPGQTCPMHIFEPRYRLMLRRCIQSGRRRFGMCAPIPVADSSPDTPRYSEVGTWLEFSKVEWLSDGRALVDTIGRGRFKVMRRSMLDGYNIGEVEQVEDIPVTADEAAQVEKLSKKIRSFISAIRARAGDRLKQQVEENFGLEPDDDIEFSFWAAAVLPIAESEKLEALNDLSPRARLARICSWIDYIQQEWWFVRGGCSVM